jgi:hypothetical protein
MKFLLLLKILLIFSSNSKKQSTKRGLNGDEDGGDDASQTAGDYLIVVDEENRRTQTLYKLSQRIRCRAELKHLFRHFIRIEVLINLYFLVFVIAPKILGGVYIELFLNPLLNVKNFSNKTLLILDELNYNLTADLNQTIYNIQPSLVNAYECDSDLDANSECFYSLAFYYLRTISIIWFATAVLKFLVQCVLLFNFFHLLVNRLTRKKRVEEERMHENYEKARQNILHTKIRAKIEETEQRLAENIEHIDFNLDLSKYSFPKRKPQTRQVSPPPPHINGSTSISMYDLTDNDKSDLNEDEKNAIEAIEYVNDINDDGFKSYNSNSNISAPKFDTFKKSTFK